MRIALLKLQAQLSHFLDHLELHDVKANRQQMVSGESRHRQLHDEVGIDEADDEAGEPEELCLVYEQ